MIPQRRKFLVAYRLEEVTADDCIDWAMSELESGTDVEHVTQLACLYKPAVWWVVAPIVEHALRELDCEEIPLTQLLRDRVLDLAQSIIDHEGIPIDASWQIMSLLERLGWPADTDSFAWDELAHGYHPSATEPLTVPELEREIRRYARRLLQGKASDAESPPGTRAKFSTQGTGTMTADAPNTRVGKPWAIVVLVLVFVVYPLSIGPAIWIVGTAGIESLYVAYDIFYQPLYALASLNDALLSMLVAYVMWWIP